MGWKVYDRFYNSHWFLTGFSCRNFPSMIRESGVRGSIRFVGVMERDVNAMVFQERHFEKAAYFYAHRMVNDHGWRRRKYLQHEQYLRRYFYAGNRFRVKLFSRMSDGKILQATKPMIRLQEKVRILGVLLNGLILDGHNHLSQLLRSELANAVGSTMEPFDYYWSILTRPTRLSMRQKKESAIVRVAREVKKGEKREALKRVHRKYEWLDYMYYGPQTPFHKLKKSTRK